ncbi:GntR family transcriptional regulator [Aeromicrobium sp. CTD01-1L150]|uniref:GntR family transcriptional regulator n=1 Tax=Aeromicrobium sp. CTD01-1L150 TaxID=3341830 RepID=UPI0035BFB0D6
MNSIKPQPLGVLIADALRRDIVNGRLRGGQELRQEEVASRFGTSRLPVRDAIQMLERDGLVVVQSNRRVVVAQFDEPEVADHYQVRALIEGETAAGCAQRGIDVGPLEEVYTALEGIASGEERSEHVGLSRQFHALIWAECGSPWLERLAHTMWQGIAPYTPDVVPDQPTLAAAEHRQIIEAIGAGDPELARQAMRNHILRSCDSLLRYREEHTLRSTTGEVS